MHDNMAGRTIGVVHLGKLRGYHYPPVDEENAQLTSYFQQSNRSLTSSHFVYVHRLQGDWRGRSSSSTYNHHHQHQVAILEVYPYLITKLEAFIVECNSNSNTNSNGNRGGSRSIISRQNRAEEANARMEEVNEGMSVKSVTSLLLDGKEHASSAYSYYQHVAESVRMMIPNGDVLPDIILLPIIPSLNNLSAALRYYYLSTKQDPEMHDMFDDRNSVINSHSTPITKSTGLTPLKHASSSLISSSLNHDSYDHFIGKQLSEYLQNSTTSSTKINLSLHLNDFSDWMIELHRCVSLHFKTQLLPNSLRSNVSQDCILLDISSRNVNVDDLHSFISASSNDIGVPVIFLDARALMAQTASAKDSRLDDQYPNSFYIESIAQFEIALRELVSSVIVLDNMDSVLYFDHQDISNGENRASNRDTSREKKLIALIDETLSLSNSRSRKTTNDGNQRCFISYSSNTSLLSSSTWALFSTVIRCTVEITKHQPETQTSNRGNIWEIVTSKDFNSDINAVCSSSDNSSYYNTRDNLINQTIYEAFKRQFSPNWLEHFGYAKKFDSNRNGVLSIKKCDIIKAREAISEQLSVRIQMEDIDGSLKKSSAKSTSNIVPVYWKDIGGMERVRTEILDVLELPLKFPHLFPAGSPRRHGVLLYGPPGTGKTLIAKAVATECKMSFLSIKGPELLDSYVGESERNVREIFLKARGQAPCILFFDEIDSLAPRRAKGTDSGGGVMDRIVSQLLTEMDLLGDGSGGDLGVFVIAATNRPDLLDPALLRPGRFDRRIYLGVSSSIETRLQILKAQTRKFSLSEYTDLKRVAQLLPENVTGADIGAVSSSAYSKALERKLKQVQERFLADRKNKLKLNGNDDDDEDLWAIEHYLETLSQKDVTVDVCFDDFKNAISTLKPSVVDLSHYERLEKQFDSGCG